MITDGGGSAKTERGPLRPLPQSPKANFDPWPPPPPMNDLQRLDAEIAAVAGRLTGLLQRRAALAGGAPSSPAVPAQDAVAMKERELRVACRDRGLPLTGDDHVLEADAAVLLRRSAKTLRNWRAENRPLAFRKRAGRIEYALQTLAQHLVASGRSDDFS